MKRILLILVLSLAPLALASPVSPRIVVILGSNLVVLNQSPTLIQVQGIVTRITLEY